jgi:C4-type Zn-finger protein
MNNRQERFDECPACGEDTMDNADMVDIDYFKDGMEETYQCHLCETEWVVTYKLLGVEVLPKEQH